jgi:hypothetical protein
MEADERAVRIATLRMEWFNLLFPTTEMAASKTVPSANIAGPDSRMALEIKDGSDICSRTSFTGNIWNRQKVLD